MPADPDVARQLEIELEQTREYLHSTIAQLENANEQMKSSNEELLSMNEELQSSNEELQTSQEELQSVNEELETVNAELHEKVQEVDRAHADIRNLFESTRVPTLFLDRHGRIKQFTPAARELFRLIDADIGRPVGDIALRLTDIDLRAEIDDVLRTLTARDRKVHRVLDDGAREAYLVRISPYRTVADVIDGAVLSFVDITELEASNERLRERGRQQAAVASLGMRALTEDSVDRFLEAVVEAVCKTLNVSRFGVFELAEQGEFELRAGRGIEAGVGDQSRAFVGGPRSLLGHPLALNAAVVSNDVSTDERFDEAGRMADEAVRSALSCAVPEAERPFGTLAVLESASRQFTDDDANFLVAVANVVATLLGRHRRLLQLRSTELQLRQQLGEVQTLYDSSPVALGVVDDELRLVRANGVLAALLGAEKPADILQRKFGDFLEPAAREQFHAILEPTLTAGGSSMGREIWSEEPPAPDSRCWLLNCAAMIVHDGAEDQIAISIVDLTQQKAQERALEHADQLKDEFLAMLGHELRNPLTAIRASVDVLRGADDLEEAVNRVNDILDRQTAQMGRLIDGLLDVSRLERGMMSLQFDSLDVRRLIQGTVRDFADSIRREGLEVDVECSDEPAWVQGDEVRLLQVFGNVLSNSIKFTPRGGRLHIGQQLLDDRVRICFFDSGVGIEPDLREEVFEPFRQAPQTIDRSRGGLGLGLPLVKGLLERHGGDIRIVEPYGPWRTIMQIELPRAVAPTASKSPRPPTARLERVLIVEDAPDIAAVLTMLVEQFGATSAVASDGVEALAAIERFHPELVLCDIGLPGEFDGIDVARMLRQRPDGASFKLVAMTGYGDADTRDRAMEAGFDAFVLKPLSREVLADALMPRGAKYS